MTIAIIDYGSGNLRSAAKSLERAALTTKQKVEVTSDVDVIAKASHIVLPGVGAFRDCMQGLQAIDGVIEVLEEQVFKAKKPFLGICVGMQLLADKGFEHGETKGLGWIAGEVVPIETRDPLLKTPHMGWNELHLGTPTHPVLKGIKEGDHAYFVHSYHFRCKNSVDVIASVEYGMPITAVIAKDNIIATQFHPEKSQETGLALLRNFLTL